MFVSSSADECKKCETPGLFDFFDGSTVKKYIDEYNLEIWHKMDALHKHPQVPVEELMSSESFFIRHATSAHNEGYKIYGAMTNRMPMFMDPFLAEKGKIDARQQGKDIINKLNIDIVLVSPLRRCIETAYLMF